MRIKGIQELINSSIIPHHHDVNYLGITLDGKLNWKAHIKRKRDELKYEMEKDAMVIQL